MDIENKTTTNTTNDVQVLPSSDTAQSQAPKVSSIPDGVPVQFWNAEKNELDTAALLKSYSELQAKQAPTEAPSEAPQENKKDAASEPHKEDTFSKYTAEYAAKGQLTPESYKELEAKGIPKAVVDNYIEGQKLRQSYGQEQVLASVGGREGFNTLSAWAASNLTDAELKGFNENVSSSVESAALAIQWLKARYESSAGKVPKLISGTPSNATSGTGFRSPQEAHAAMRDPRYGRDVAYSNEVAQRLATRTYKI